MCSQFLTKLIEPRWFSFKRVDGSIISDRIQLRPDGIIFGHAHPNEHSWSIAEEGIVFLDHSGLISTIFDRIEQQENGSLSVLGRFRADWTQYAHRLDELVLAFASIVDENEASPSTSASVAVLVRTHQCDTKYFNLMNKLDTNRRQFDLYAIVDETRRRNNPGPWPTIWHSADSCLELGLPHWRHDLLWYCGDYPLYFALRELPDYRFYVMVEDDVELRDPDAAFVNELCRFLEAETSEGIDFIATTIASARTRLSTSRFAPTLHTYKAKHASICNFPFVVTSKRFLSFLFSQRQVEAARGGDQIMFCEEFVATAARASGFRIMDLNEVFPGCYEDSKMMMHIYADYGRPLGASVELSPTMRVFHPIYTADEWVTRVYRNFFAPNAGHPERSSEVLGNLARERAHAQKIGDSIMLEALEGLSDRLSEQERRILQLPQLDILLSAPSADASPERWYPIERGTHGPFRWTASRQTGWEVNADLSTPAMVRFTLPIVIENAPGSANASHLEFGEKQVPLRRGKNGWIAEVLVEGAAPTEVTLVTPPLRSPAELRDSKDTRKLGFAIAVH